MLVVRDYSGKVKPVFACKSVFAWRGVPDMFKPIAHILIFFYSWINLPSLSWLFFLWFILNRAEIIPTDRLSSHLRMEITTTLLFTCGIYKFVWWVAGAGGECRPAERKRCGVFTEKQKDK